MINDRFRRLSCHAHFMERARQRGLNIAASDIARLESVIEKARHLLTPNEEGRVLVAIKARGENLRVIYDLPLCCVVSVWEQGNA